MLIIGGLQSIWEKAFEKVLPKNVPAVILLQSGNRSTRKNEAIVKRLTAPGVKVKLWARAEIENYLLDPGTIARVSGAALEIVTVKINHVISNLREATRAIFIAEWVASAQEGYGRETLVLAEEQFDVLWRDVTRRVEVIRGTQVIKELNAWLEHEGYRPITAYRLAKATKPQALVHRCSMFLWELTIC